MRSRRFGAQALGGAVIGALALAMLVAGAAQPAAAAVPLGYAAVTGWSVAGTTGSASLPGNGSGLGTVTTTAPLQIMAVPNPAALVDGVAVPRISLTAAQIAAGRTACLNGATPGSTRECNSAANKRTTITFPEPVVDPVIAVVAQGAVYTSGGANPTYCSTSWMNFTVLSVNGSPVAPGQVSAPTVSAAQRFVGGALIYDPTLMTPSARQCVDPTQGGGVSYLKISGVVTSVYVDSEYRAAVTRNTTGTTTRIASAPPGWQFQSSVPKADLSVTASASAAVASSGQIEWTYTVRNAGPGASHGFEVTSEIPAGVVGVTVVSGPDDCTVNAGILRCSQTPPDCIVVTQDVGDTWASLLCFDEVSPVPTVLAPGGTAPPIVVRGTVAAGAASPLLNKVTVSGADVDPAPANNSVQASTLISSPSVTVVARVTPTGPVSLRSGDPLVYEVDVTNSGNIDVSAATVSRTAFTGSGAPPVVTCPAGTIGVGATITCTGTYALTQADVDGGTVALSVTATASSAVGVVPVSPAATATTVIVPLASLALATRSDTSQVTTLGQSVVYFFDITNTGTVTLTGPTVTLVDFTGTGTAPEVTCPAGAVAPGASVTCTAPYDVAAEDAVLTTLEITSTATADLLEGDGTPISALSSLAIPVTVPAAALTLTQDMTPPDGSTVARGRQVEFVITAVNSGGRPLDAVVTADLSGILTAAAVGDDAEATIDGVATGVLTRVGSTLTWTGILPVGRSVMLRYSATVSLAAVAGEYCSSASARGTPVGEPAIARDGASTAFVVAPSGLPHTGIDRMVVAGATTLALILLAAGGLLVMVRRRRVD